MMALLGCSLAEVVVLGIFLLFVCVVMYYQDCGKGFWYFRLQACVLYMLSGCAALCLLVRDHVTVDLNAMLD